MIPHHSIAILTSERADLDDVRVRELADAIIEAQRKEIQEMDWLVEGIGKCGPATTDEAAQQRPVPDFEAEVATEPCHGRHPALAMDTLGGYHLVHERGRSLL